MNNFAAAENTTIQNLVDAIVSGILTPLIGFLFVLATVVFLWGVMQYLAGSQGDQKKIDSGKAVMKWGIIGMFIMASSWGIVKLLCDFFGTCDKIF